MELFIWWSKQRVSIARALLKNPNILIFDDCLSALIQNQKKNIENLKEIMIDKTTILVSHRISSIKHVDHIIMIEDGRIIEEGTHDELCAVNGKYKNLYQKQRIEE